MATKRGEGGTEALERPGARDWVPESVDLAGLRTASAGCRGCELWESTTQVVFSTGAPDAKVMLVGEQPGDIENQEGVPFVGPAGRLLHRAMDEAGIEEQDAYLTNAVKHFRFVQRGKRPAKHRAETDCSWRRCIPRRDWRVRRRRSQLDLSLEVGISARHLSFVETGRARPSRETLELVLRGHGPYPAAVVDRNWNLLSANASLGVLIESVDPALLTPPDNVLRASLHPRGMAPRIRNLPQWRSHLLHRLARQVALTGDPLLSRPLEEAREYPAPGQDREPQDASADSAIAVPLRIHSGERELCFLSTVTTFGTAIEITASERSMESFFPAEAATADLLRGLPLR